MDEEEAEAFSDIFTSIFSINDISWAACDWGSSDIAFVDSEIVRN